MPYMLIFSYKNTENPKTTNGIPFKQGDTVSVQGSRAAGITGWNSSLDGIYKVIELTSRGLVVTGSPTAKWGDGSINMPMNGITVSASGGASISGAGMYQIDSRQQTTDWWMHAFITPNTSGPVTGGGYPLPESRPPHKPPAPQPPRPVIDPGPPFVDDGNNLTTDNGRFNIDKFIVQANFKAGTSSRENNIGAAQFIADATSAAKTAKLNKAQTKKLLDAVNKAIADARAKVKNKLLPKPKGRKK